MIKQLNYGEVTFNIFVLLSWNVDRYTFCFVLIESLFFIMLSLSFIEYKKNEKQNEMKEKMVFFFLAKN
jgi:hypothetical protein